MWYGPDNKHGTPRRKHLRGSSDIQVFVVHFVAGRRPRLFDIPYK